MHRRCSLRIQRLAPLFLFVLGGCGGASTPPNTPGFTLTASPNSLVAAETSTSGAVTLTAMPVNGFTGSITVAIAGLPTGVSASPSSPFTLSVGSSQPVTFTVGSSVPRGNYAVKFSGASASRFASAGLTLSVGGAPVTAATGNFKQQVIYQIVTDRFFNGDTTNDDPPQSKGLFDPTGTNFQMYWGGDFAGIQQKMAYLAGMGITAIWISPPVDNIDVAAVLNGSAFAPYHGYWARDMMCLEEHFGDVSPACSWTAFDNMVAAAHQNGIRVIVDFASNDSNPNDAGEFGALLDKGQPFASFQNDPVAPFFFHHNPTIADFTDAFQLQYDTLADLADLNQDRPAVDQYLKGALVQFMNHGVDAFRLDAVKHVTWGWEYSLANTAFTTGPTFLFGEWAESNTSDPRYPDSRKFSNHSGISLLDFPLANAFRDVFGDPNLGDFHELDNALSVENHDFLSSNDLVTFFDSHDLPRLLSVNNSTDRLNEALALLLACRGIPVVLYGDEQYLHNDTNGGGDPYNRVQMSSFNTQTTAYSLINLMSQLRQNNPALAYGTSIQRWLSFDVYVLERQFSGNVVLIAVNKSDSTTYPITGLLTSLAPGLYADYLSGLLGGVPILTVNSGSANNNPVTNFNLPPHSVSVWQFALAATAPRVGSIGPALGQAGISGTIAGQGFGAIQGTLLFVGASATAAATINSWSDATVAFTVPAVTTPGTYNVQLTTKSGANANTVPFTVLTGPLIPVTFTVNNVPQVSSGGVYLTGNVIELGSGVVTPDAAVGPLLTTNPPNWFIDASVPAGATIQFQFAIIDSVGNVTMEAGSPHPYKVPTSGVGAVTVTW
jgi:glycosidase